MSKDTISHYTENELKALKSATDWERLDCMTEEELDATIASDPDWRNIPRDWYKHAKLVAPKKKKALKLDLDQEVYEWFKSHDREEYKLRMSAILKAYVDAQKASKRKNTE